MPKNVTLDGEFWIGRGKFQDTANILKRNTPAALEWNQIKFKGNLLLHTQFNCTEPRALIMITVFDAPSLEGMVFEDRMKWIEEYFAAHPNPFVQVVQHERCEGNVFSDMFDRYSNCC